MEQIDPVDGAPQSDGGTVLGRQPGGGHLASLPYRDLGGGGGEFALCKFLGHVPQDKAQHQPQPLELIPEPCGNGIGVGHHPVDIFGEIAADLRVHLLGGKGIKPLAAVMVHHLLENIVDGGAGLEGRKLHPLAGAQPQHFIAEKLVGTLVEPVDGGGGEL